VRRDHRAGVPAVAVASRQPQHARTVSADPDLRHPAARGFEIHRRSVEPVVLAGEGDRPSCPQTQADDLQGLLQPGHRLGEVQPVRVDIHALAGADAEDGCALGQMRQRRHRLCDHHGMPPDHLSHPDTEAQPPGPRREIAQQNLVVEELVRARAVRGEPGQFPVPDGSGKNVLEVIDDHHRVQPHSPRSEEISPDGAQWRLRPDLQSHRDSRICHDGVTLPFPRDTWAREASSRRWQPASRTVRRTHTDMPATQRKSIPLRRAGWTHHHTRKIGRRHHLASTSRWRTEHHRKRRTPRGLPTRRSHLFGVGRICAAGRECHGVHCAAQLL
jgi:hypothetical protein